MKNSELLELVGKKVSFEVHEDMHIGENKTITWQAGLSGELTENPPATRVRVRQRIRRWDGYCVLCIK